MVSGRRSTLFVLLFTVFVCYDEADGQGWGYIDGVNGPEEWVRLGYRECNGRRQSPIDISSSDEYRETKRKLYFFGYDESVTGRVQNTGSTVEVQLRNKNKRGIEVDGRKYYLQDLHFHFGSNHRTGSEHLINGMSYPMELHLVHQSRNNEQAVVGILFSEVRPNNTAINPLVRAVEKVRYKDEQALIDQPIKLESVVPTCNYHRYNGSLTTPPCSENVLWFILDDTVRISSAQMETFRRQYETSRSTRKRDQRLMVNNFRKIQRKNHRPIHYFTGSQNCGL